MSSQVALFAYAALMFSLALVVRWEFLRRRKGPSLRAGDLDQIGGPRITYTAPPDRSKRSMDAMRRY